MTLDATIGGFVSVVMLIYLIYTLLRPEKF